MEINDIRKMSSEEIKKNITSKKEELFTKRMQQASGTLEKPKELNALRKEIARMKTILKQREMESEK